MTLDRDRPEILQPPEHPQACCAQQAITVPPGVLAKTAQKHDYPSAPWRRSYARRTGAERGFATIKDPATSDITRGWCRLMVLTPLMLFATTLLIVRNQRILRAWDARQEDSQRRAAKGGRPKPASDAARPSPTSPPDRTNPGAATTAAATRRKHAPTQDNPRWPSSPGGQAWPQRPARSGHPSSSPGCPAADLINRSAVFSRRWQRSAGLPGQR